MSQEALTLRHANRMVLLDRLGYVRSQVQELEREIGDIERTVRALPYAGQQVAAEAARPQAPRCGFFANAAAGGIALPLAIGCMHPLDTVRTVMQAALHNQQGLLTAASSLGWRGFVRGIGPSIAWASPQGAIRLGCYELNKEMLAERQGCAPAELGAFGVSVSAVTADVASSVVKVPRELVTQRMQTGRYTSSLGALRGIVREDGVLGLFRGYWSTCLRDAPFVVLLFISYEQFKAWKIRLVVADDGPAKVFAPWSSAETILWGGVSGGIAGFLTTPFDVIKTRIMTAKTAVTMSQAAREIGPYGLFTGAGPRSAWWFCVASIFFASYERLRVSIQDHVDAPYERR